MRRRVDIQRWTQLALQSSDGVELDFHNCLGLINDQYMALKPPKPAKSLNVISVKLAGYPPAIVPQLGNALATAGGVTIGEDTFLVPGDFSEWCFFLAEVSGGDERLYKIYSLSAFEGGHQGLQPRVRAMARDHLISEFARLGMQPPTNL